MPTAISAINITPSDNSNLVGATVGGLFIGGAGNVTATLVSGTTVTFTGVAAGTLLPVAAVKVFATGTTASNIVGLMSPTT